MEMGDCKRSGDGLEKRLSKLEGVCGRLDGVSDSIHKIKEGIVHINGAFCTYYFHFKTPKQTFKMFILVHQLDS